MVVRIDYQSIYILILYISAAICLITSIFSFRRKPAFGALPLGILLASIATASFFQAFVFSIHGLQGKLFAANLRYIGIEMIPVSFLALTYEHTKRQSFFKTKKLLPMLVVSFMFFLLLITNQYHFLFYRSVSIHGNILILENGMGFWLNIIYIYSCTAAGIIYLFKDLSNSTISAKRQTFVLILSTLIPFALSMIFNLNIIHAGNIDITPLAFSLTGLFGFLGLFKFRLFDVIPIAKGELFENLQDSVIILDNNNSILAINKQALSLFDRIFTGPSGDYIGRSVFDVHSIFENITLKLSVNGILKEKVSICVDNEIKYFYLLKNPIYNNNGKLKGSLIVLKDISELEIALYEAQSSQKAAEAANQSKSRFLAGMSHEIRTPMNAIIGISDILYSTSMSVEEQKKNLKTLMNSASGLLSILNDVLDYSKIEAGKLELEKTVIHLKELIEETVDIFAIHAQNKNISIETQSDKQLPEYVSGDPTRLKQILSNLISNSLKFTAEGQINISAEVFEIHDERCTVKFTVSDTGIGIPNEKISNLFESFKQLDNSTTRKYGGTGLGLTIVKNLVEMMEGNIRVESEIGAGSSFIFTIPFDIAQVPKESLKKTNLNSSLSFNNNINIIVAEDNKVNQNILKMFLAKKNMKADYADNGKILLQMLEAKQYELILMDMQMPEIDGLEATAMIREKEQVTDNHIIIIALTANAMKGDRELCINAGMDDYLTKPLRYNDLSEMINKYFS
ncbi:MAG: histidine kinase N-terminal 7TM domain-containing protein [Bacillota bacterium]|nr:histidine kinase N-terminal 7TM domain-containing protein [Bacillota bacterium]